MNFGAWNVRTLMDCATSDRPERRTAIVARELRRCRIDIAALSETRRAEEGHLKEEKGGYTFFWKGKATDEPRIHGVGFAIKNQLISQLSELPVGISERLMTLRLVLDNNQTATVLSAYAPTLVSDEEVKETFYACLDEALSKIPKEDKIILLGDFNARVGRDHHLWKGTIGKEGTGNINSNGVLLLSKCAQYDLTITNTIFRQKNKFKASWRHPRSKQWHLIDYVIVRARDQRDVNITKAMIDSEDCWTDHRLIRSTMSIRLKGKRRLQKKQSRQRLNLESLNETATQQLLQASLGESLSQEYPENIEEHWSLLKSSILDTCSATLGYKSRKQHQDWFDENDAEIEQLISKKREAFRVWQNDITCKAKRQAHSRAKADVQSRVRQIKNSWWTERALEIQRLADSGDTRGFFSATKAVYGPSHRGQNPLRSKDGQELLKDNESINNRWREHFQELLNRDSTTQSDFLGHIPQSPIREDMGEPPTLAEVQDAIRSLKINKATGPDGIPAEVLKEGGPELQCRLHALLLKVWEKEELPSELRDALIVTIFKKGDKADCGNYRGISLLSTTGKVLARVLANRLLPLSEEVLPESQCGFRPSRGTADMIFTARQLQEKCREHKQPLYMAFIDLTKAFDTVDRQALWSILLRYGCPDKYVRILRLLHDGMTATVLNNSGSLSEPFTVETGVKQGCIIAPTLFSVFIAFILHLIGKELPQGIPIWYRTDGRLFNLNRFKAKTKIRKTIIMELQYADDNAIAAHSAEDLQGILNAFAKAYRALGLAMNIKKTQVLHQPPPNQPSTPPIINVDNTTLVNVDHFPYLGSFLSSKADIDSEVNHRLSCASGAYGRLRKRVFEDRDLRVDTKLLVYKAVVLPTLLYGAESWTTYSRHLRALEQHHQRTLRTILRIKWEDRRTNIGVLEEAKMPSITTLIMQHQLRWTGHLIRMPDTRLPKQMLYSQLERGPRAPGGQKKRFKDNIKTTLKKFLITSQDWEHMALNRHCWRAAVQEGAAHHEKELRRVAETKRQLRKERQKQAPARPQPTTTFPCPHCTKICGSRIGLYAHLRTHK